MQQTTTYKLNKPESTDTFSVSPLNENADKLEAQLARLDGADAAETTARQALDARVTALEVHKVVFGTYTGTSQAQIIELGFTPIAVLCSSVKEVGQTQTCLIVTGNYVVGGSDWDPPFTIVEGGFRLGKSYSSTAPFNKGSLAYNYVAFG